MRVIHGIALIFYVENVNCGEKTGIYTAKHALYE